MRMACTLAVLNGLYFGILTRDLAEVNEEFFLGGGHSGRRLLACFMLS